MTPAAELLLAELARLRLELENRGWRLERQGALEAADVALAAAARIGEMVSAHPILPTVAPASEPDTLTLP